ncbi:hypothetical protein G5C66_06335 [Nocardioides sp. KC13]|uniref:Uncharacterized protein n=1 Tax=Nocardioides turkmenicus TaxID=2711220 RepID=A0A6M1R3Y4_9ACTN|nr:hypothetical protein [Nocardioides sp. KC13]NGN92359.1 hypothetical protein [Nocardioides sp. KC13]
MSMRDAVRRTISADFVGEVTASATDRFDEVSLSLGVRGEVTNISVLQLTPRIKSLDGFVDAIFDAANRAETARVISEIALSGDLPSGDSPTTRPELPGPTAPGLAILSPGEQANQLQRYIDQGGLDYVDGPRSRRGGSRNGYLTLTLNDRGQLVSVDADQQWLWSATLERINAALKEALES